MKYICSIVKILPGFGGMEGDGGEGVRGGEGGDRRYMVENEWR
jgi:hypothetical protein